MVKMAPLTFYLIAILLLAISITLAYQLAHNGLIERENDAKVVNLAGRQRMLSQQIAKICLQFQYNSPDPSNRISLKSNLDHALSEWQLARKQLQGETPLDNFTVQNSIRLYELFDSIDKPYQRILKSIPYINPDSTYAKQESSLKIILEQEPVFLKHMDEIVLQYQKESTQKIQQLAALETFIWLFTLLLLCMELLFIFIPLNWQINRAMREKNEQNQLLIEKQQALESSIDLMQRMQQNLLEAEKLATLGETVGVITHEINTPIGIAVTAASSLQEYTKDLWRQYHQEGLRKSVLEAYISHAKDGTDLVLNNLEKAALLLNDFKNVAVKQISGQQEHFDLCVLTTQVANTLRPLFKNTAVVLRLELPERLEIDSHPGLFAQIIMNLVTNSLRHGYPDEPKKGTITISLTSDSNFCNLVYQDDGIGIPNALVPKIFDPFFSTDKQNGGTGLGLNIVQHLVVQQLGGIISLDTKVYHGVRFNIRIPIK